MPVARREGAPPLGVVYTPADVARAMVELALAPLLANRDVRDLRICDPACGEGAFLVEVVKLLAERTGVDARTIRERCIYGVDVDARAVEAARRTLGTDHVYVGDALAFDWAQLGPFDLVIGNPPYIRQELLADKATLRGFESYDGVADLYVYFIELAHRIVRPGGRYCFITPNKWLTVAYGRSLRAFLAKQASVEGVVDMTHARVFDEDAFPCVVWGTIGGASPLHAVRGDLAAARIPHDRARWTDAPWHIDEPSDRALIDELCARWPAFDAVAGTPARGVVTGANDVFLLDRATRDRLVGEDPAAASWIRSSIRGRHVQPYRAVPDDYLLLIDHGTELDELPSSIIDYLEPFRDKLEPKPARGPGPGRKPGRYRWYQLQDPVGAHSASRAPRLFYQDIQTGPACSLDETGLVPDTTVWTLPTSDRFLLAVLNSPLYGWYALRRFPPALGGSVRPKRAYLAALPIATPSRALRAKITALVDERLLTLTGASPALDAAIADAVLDAYDLTASQRAVVARAAGDRGRTAARRSHA